MLVQALQNDLFVSGIFLPFSACWSCTTFVRGGFQFVGRGISVLDYLYFSSYMFGRMESINVVGVLEETEYADRRACMRSYFKLNISSIPTLSHLLDCLICTRSSTFIVLFLQGMGCFDRWQVVDLHQLVGSGTGSVYYHIVLVFFGMFFLSFLLAPFWVVGAQYLWCLFLFWTFLFFVSCSFNVEILLLRSCCVCGVKFF